jgi:sugar lactone lactonase YvrE
VARLAVVPACDLLVELPGGDLLTGGGPAISRISPAGAVTALATGGFEQVRGLAYDPTGRRLFVIDHSATVGVADQLRILPLER